jgi:3D (Asp-Asp-Asp) domain-containing protein
MRILSVAILAALALQPNGAQAQSIPEKHRLPALAAPACRQIEANAGSFVIEQVTRMTRYFTPIFQPGPDGALREADRRHCLQIQGSCIVGGYLYNAGGGPSGTRYERAAISFIFGQGSGRNDYNRTNALFPCRTVAADLTQYKIGTVLFIPALKGRTCPQNGQPVDGCFIVGDKGGAIRGQGRFDMFGGECAAFDGARYQCRDANSTTLEVRAGTPFYVVPREHRLASDFRDQLDAFVRNGWKPAGAR